MKTLSALLFSLVLFSHLAPAFAVPAKVRIFDDSGYKGEVSFLADGKEVSKATLSGSNQWIEFNSFEILPDKPLALKGKFSTESEWWRGPASGMATWKVINIAPMTSPLRDKKADINIRLKSFISAKEEFTKRNAAVLEDAFLVEMGEKVAPGELATAEKRLGFELPAEYKSLLQNSGLLQINDSYFTSAPSLLNAYEQMIKDWGTPEAEMLKLSAKLKYFLKSHVILFTEVGDGLGGLLYGEDGYYWIHQDTMQPDHLSKRKSGFDFSDAFLWLFVSQGFQYYDTGSEVALTDSSSPAAVSYNLVPEGDNKSFAFRLEIDWSAF